MSGLAPWQAERAAALADLPIRPTVVRVIRVVAREFDVPVRDILGARRSARITGARQVAMHLALQLSGHSSTTIGRVMDRDHTTVLHGDQVTRMRADECPELAARIAAVRTALTLNPIGDA